MRASMLVWVFPLGILGGVMLVSLGSIAGLVIAMVWGFVVFPGFAAYLCRHLRRPDGSSLAPDAHELATDYWRTTLR